MKLFEFDIHIGDWRVLVQSRDIQNGAIQSRHLPDMVITTEKIGDGEVKSRNIAPMAVTSPKIGDGEVKSQNIGKEAVQSRHIENNAIKGDHFEDDTLHHGKIADDAIWERNIKDRNVTSKKIAQKAILNEHLSPKSVRPENASDDFLSRMVLPITEQIDRKYKAKTDELYNMIESLQVGGVALSNELGDREDIGVSQKAITKIVGKIWEAIQDPSHRVFDFTLTVVPSTSYSESDVEVTVTADCSQAISDFDNIKIFVDDVLVAESSDITVFTTSVDISKTSEIKAVGMILGKIIEKTATVNKETPFFMGSGNDYSDIMNEECRKEIDGTLEGEYDLTVNNDGEHMFIIIPASRKNEFRRASMGNPDMGGYEIPLDMVHEDSDIVAYKSKAPDGYLAGTYNIDININS